MKFLVLFTLQWSNYRFVRLYNGWLAEKVVSTLLRKMGAATKPTRMFVVWRVWLKRLNQRTTFMPKLPPNKVIWQRLLLHNLQICTNIPAGGSTSALTHTASPWIIGLLKGYLTRGQDQISNSAFLSQRHLTLLWERMFTNSFKWVTSFGRTDICKWKPNEIQWRPTVDLHFKTGAANVCL